MWSYLIKLRPPFTILLPGFPCLRIGHLSQNPFESLMLFLDISPFQRPGSNGHWLIYFRLYGKTPNTQFEHVFFAHLLPVPLYKVIYQRCRQLNMSNAEHVNSGHLLLFTESGTYFYPKFFYCRSHGVADDIIWRYFIHLSTGYKWFWLINAIIGDLYT